MGALKKFWIVAIWCVLAVTAGADKIGQVTFEQLGSYKLSEDELKFNVQSRSGDEFVPKNIDADVKRLTATGSFADVVAESRHLPDGKVDVTFKLMAKPMVQEIKFVGNRKFPTSDLDQEITLRAELPLNDKNLRESANKLRRYYRDKGYNEATVTPEVKSSGKNSVTVTFRIDEHLRLKVNDVTFSGNTVFSSWDLKWALATRHSFLSRFFEIGLYNPRELELDKLRLRQKYWTKGYLDFKVEDIKVTPEAGNPEYVDVNFKLFEGKPYTVDKVTITGNRKIGTVELERRVLLHHGQIFDLDKENQTKDAIEAAYAALGYADFQCRAVRHPNFQTHLVDIDFELTEGIPYTVYDVNIKGNKVTKDKVIRRELVIQDGDPVDKNRIEVSKSRLMGMGYFEDVKTSTANAEEYGRKNVTFSVKEKRNYEFKIGGGFSDVDSLFGMVSLTNNNFDITDPERYFQGGGQRLRLAGIFGLRTYGGNIDFTEPWLFDMPLRWDLSGYWNQVTYRYWDEQRIGFRTALTKKFFDDFTSVSLGYKFEQVNVYDMDNSATALLKSERGRDWVSSPSLEITRDTRDSLTDPTSGYLVSALTSVTPKFLGSSNNYYRLESKGIYYMNFLDKALIWHNGFKIGTIASFDRDDPVPLYERYFLGGGDSIRGFPYRRISPVDNNGWNIGGQTMLLLTSEITHPIWRFIRGAVFVDAGSAWKNSYSMGFNQFNMGAGYGLRMKLPMINAPIKLDLAYPIVMNQENCPRRLQFHFNMGFTW
ncbi:MAG: outer membrane protein assembly factor BamA [Victivallales bacterium]|nr:outer membrane protein assembly factor BamA [Victivallales bacterium]